MSTRAPFFVVALLPLIAACRTSGPSALAYRSSSTPGVLYRASGSPALEYGTGNAPTATAGHVTIPLVAGARGASAVESPWTLGLRTGVALAEGEPANDIPVPIGIFVRRRWNEDWSVAASLELAKGDYERPYEFVGESSPDEIDGEAKWTTVSVWVERDFSDPASRNEWYALAGIGVAEVDVEDPPNGPLDGGGTFDIETDVEREIVPSVGLGYRRRLGRGWALEALARYDYHLTDWKVRDVATGATGEVDDYGAFAILVGVSYGF